MATRAGKTTGPSCFYFGKITCFFSSLSPCLVISSLTIQLELSMRLFNQCPWLLATLLLGPAAWPDCLPVEEARKHVGEIKCVTSKVVRVKLGTRGVHFLDFCDDFRLCPSRLWCFPAT